MIQNNISDKKQKNETYNENIIFSRVVPAGKRMYYLDVRKTRRGDLFLTLTESKKIIDNYETNAFHLGKQKIFIYQEDFNKFMKNFNEIFTFIEKNIN